MTDTTALNAFIGGVGHLKLHAPAGGPCVESTACDGFANFHTMNTAFQQATGWELSYRETSSSFRYRSKKGRGAEDCPPIGELAICDLSPLLPPGIPAVSRIYSEKLVEEFNKVLAELGSLRRHGPDFGSDGGQTATRCSPTKRSTIPGKTSFGNLAALRTNLPFETANISLTPLMVDEGIATFEWFVDSMGVARFAMIACNNGESNSTRELIAARSTFLAECRHNSSNDCLMEAMVDTVGRLFDQDSQADAMVGTLNPLTGDLTICGSERFLGVASTASLNVRDRSAGGLKLHLSRGQHVAFSLWPDNVGNEEVKSWKKETVTRFRDLDSRAMKALFQTRLADAIPSIAASPLIAIAISRH